MSNWALQAGGAVYSGRITSPAWGGAAHVKGAWTEVIPASPWAADGLVVSIAHSSANARRYLVDVGIGPAGAERVLAPNLALAKRSYGVAGYSVTLPVQVPAGSRISLRYQQSGADDVPVGVWTGGWNLTLLGSNPLWPTAYQRVVSVGAVEATTELTVVPQSGTPWVELTPAAPFRVRAICPLYMGGAPSVIEATITIGSGPVGQEAQVGPLITVASYADGSMPNVSGPFPVDIPAGTRLSARASGQSNTALHQVGLLLFG